MSHAARLAREDAITECLRAATAALGDEEPTAQAFTMIDAIKRLRDGQPVRVMSTERRDYMADVQGAARAQWHVALASAPAPNPDHYQAVAGIDTPLGRLRVVTWRRAWTGDRGDRIAWASEYYLNDEPITVAEIKAMGLAQRPTTRNRKRS
ncbi:MAG: hypothetical protein E5V51_00275 [Mesorhizobium sp.]|nr:hypothetical protein EOA35_01080 [Mesorhizobium sp. M8A.F.Ca.ET.023.01.1.1]TIW90640.1 MAG: hypothetical protein E5V51_00275 [Mesorhizobium sp.]